MSAKVPKKNTTPRTVQQLVPWLNSEMGSLANLIRRLVGVTPADDHFSFQATESREVLIHQFIGSLNQALSHLEGLLQTTSPTLESTSISDLSRALLLSGNGDRFEPAIRSAIRAYCDTLSERFRFCHRKGIRDQLRQDLLAGFARISATQEQDLRILGVEMEEVEPGSQLDTSRHQVVKHVPTDDPKSVNTIRHCITPIFRWKSDHVLRLEPARVIAYSQSTTEMTSRTSSNTEG